MKKLTLTLELTVFGDTSPAEVRGLIVNTVDGLDGGMLLDVDRAHLATADLTCTALASERAALEAARDRRGLTLDGSEVETAARALLDAEAAHVASSGCTYHH